MNLAQTLVLIFAVRYGATAQSKFPSITGDTMAVKILTKAIPQLQNGKSYAMYFDRIGYKLSDPKKIMSLPSYAYHKGGYMFIDDPKVEIRTGIIEAVSDGKLMVFMNKAEHVILVDSIRKLDEDGNRKFAERVQMNYDQKFKNAHYKYMGLDSIGGVLCHKIKTSFKPVESGMEAIYWVKVKDDKLFAWAEKQGKLYDTYVVKEIGAPPANHNYTIKRIPSAQDKLIQGYEVVDFRELQRWASRNAVTKNTK